MTTSRISIKLGAIEVEYEGSESFLKEDLQELLRGVAQLYEQSKAALESSSDSADEQQGNPAAAARSTAKLQATTGSIAAKLNASSGPELILAAAARLTLALQMETFSRQKLTEEMKTATAYYKPTYVKNLSGYLKNLIKDGKLNEPSQGNFALTASSLRDMEQRLV
jgi:hypothetical protein